MKRFNWLDAVIILVLLLAAAAVVFYFNRLGGGVNTKITQKIAFDVEVTLEKLNICESYKVGEGVTFGAKNVDRGVIKNVVIKEHERPVANTQEGIFEMRVLPDYYDAVVTIEFEGTETETEFKATQEQVNIGAQMIFHGKGFAGRGFVTAIYPNGR